MPTAVKDLFISKCFPLSEALLYVKSDIDRDFNYADVYIVATSKTLAVLSLKSHVVSDSSFASPRLSVEYEHYAYDEYELCRLSQTSCRMHISSGILVSNVDGESVLLSRFSMSSKNRLFTFVENLNLLCEKGSLSEDEIKVCKEELCPKCGGRYTDSARKLCPKCMDKSKLIKRLSVFFSRYKIHMLISFLGLILTTALSVLTPYLQGSVLIDEVLEPDGSMYGDIIRVVLLLVCTKLLVLVTNGITTIISAKISARVVFDIKKSVFSNLSRLSYGFFTSRQTGGLMTSVNGDADSIYNFFCSGLPFLLINAVQFIVIIGIMLSIQPLMTVLALITVPVIVFIYKRVFSAFDKLYASNFSKRRSFNSLVTDVLSGIRVVKAFSKEQREVERFNKSSSEFAKTDKAIGMMNSGAFPAIGFIMRFGTYVVMLYGGFLVMRGKMSYGIYITFVGYLGMIYSPLQFFSSVSRWWAECMNAIQRVFEIFDSIPEVEESQSPTPLENVRGKVCFSNVSFGYDKTRKALEGIDFTVCPGETIGIVGETGAGKSTLVNLLIRLYDVDEGGIFIDDVNIKQLSFETLRSCVGIVSQETYIFEGTIMENIRYAKPDATDQEVLAAAKLADAHSFIIKYPEAYETLVGRGKKALSGGECQRISIARAILKNPPILILDEATSAMDTATERRIQRAISRLSKDKTTIMIAHRLSTLRDADRIVVIENGKMPEIGTHKELLDLRGTYYGLFKLQAQALKTIGIE